MKKVAITVLAVFALAATAKAQGTWYTDSSTYNSRITTIGGSASYNSLVTVALVSSPYTEGGVTATSSSSFISFGDGTLTTGSTAVPITFSFSGNAFSGMFGTRNPAPDGMNFSVDGSLTNVYSLTSLATGYKFLGYISDTSSPINVTVRGDATPAFITVDSFTFGNGTNPTPPGGGAVPEPGTVVSMGLLGAGVLGLVIRSRRRISN